MSNVLSLIGRWLTRGQVDPGFQYPQIKNQTVIVLFNSSLVRAALKTDVSPQQSNCQIPRNAIYYISMYMLWPLNKETPISEKLSLLHFHVLCISFIDKYIVFSNPIFKVIVFA